MSAARPKPNPAPGGTPDDIDFEKAIEQVEKIIQRIESGEVGLEKSIAEYERGAALIKRCREVLDRAEQKVQDLTSQMHSGGSGGGGGEGGRRSAKPDRPPADEEAEESPF